ncbi:NAD-dependent epimerase/dehydratase family protein [Streptomyces sp. L7]
MTVLNRGRHEPLPGVQALRGDRTAPGGLAALAEGECGRRRRHLVGGAPARCTTLRGCSAGRAGRYVYVSSRSVYEWAPPAGYTEDAPVVEGAEPDADKTDYARTSGAGSWPRSIRSGAERSVFVRAGLILGPYENIGRLPWWLNRVARSGPVLAPGPRELALQYVDVRDLAEWVLGSVEQELSGAYNLTSPQGARDDGVVVGRVCAGHGWGGRVAVDLCGCRARGGYRAVDSVAGVDSGRE